MDEAEFRKRFAALYPNSLDIINDVINFERDFSPTVDYGAIFHYTSAETAKIILNKKTIRFTKISLLNDSSEYKHALGVFCSVSDRIISDNQNIKIIEPYFRKIFDNLAIEPDIYVACFSRDEDKLSQWRGYTPRNEGVAIAFDSLNLTSAFLEYIPAYDIIYDHNRQNKLIEKLLNTLVNSYRNNSKKSDLALYMESTSRIVERTLKTALSVMKNDVWKEENEIRLLLDLATSQNLKHLIGTSTRSIDIRMTGRGSFPIIGVTLGPSFDNARHLSEITGLINNKELQNHIIIPSNIPLR